MQYEMQYRKLGNTGFDVSVLGFGTWQIGGGRWNASADPADAVKLLQQAKEHGINLYDVAVVYGQYRNEKGYLESRSQELLGAAFNKEDRKGIYYCVKLGQYDEYSHSSNYSAERIVEQLQHSLRRLNTDYIDICLIHAPSLSEVRDAKAITILHTLKAQGIVKSIGYSFENEPEHVMHGVKQDIDVIMLQYNLIDAQCGTSFKDKNISPIEAAADAGIGIIVGGPFKRGYLTGKYDSADDLPNDDYWQFNIAHNKGKVEQLLAKVSELKAQYGGERELRRAALQYILSRPQGLTPASSTVIGFRSVEEIVENISHIS